MFFPVSFKSLFALPQHCTHGTSILYSQFLLTYFSWSFRSGEDWRCQRLTLNREVLSVAGMNRFLPLLDSVGEDFVRRVYTQVERSGRGKWTADLSDELFRFALECKYKKIIICVDFYYWQIPIEALHWPEMSHNLSILIKQKCGIAPPPLPIVTPILVILKLLQYTW